MAGTSIYSVYRRTARAAAKQQVVKKTSNIDVERARKDFAYFCDVVGDNLLRDIIRNGINIYVREKVVSV